MNNAVWLVFTILTAATYTYLVLCMFQVMVSWFGGGTWHSGFALIHRITRPWLRLFSGIRFLKSRSLDFSPVAALLVLQLLARLFYFIAVSGRLTLALVVATLIELVFSTINFFILFFIILGVVRLVGLLIKTSSVQRFWFTLDHILQPMVYPILGRLFPRRVVPYGTGLGIFLLVMTAVYLLIMFSTEALMTLARAIPF